jgi:hypothetical protein
MDQLSTARARSRDTLRLARARSCLHLAALPQLLLPALAMLSALLVGLAGAHAQGAPAPQAVPQQAPGQAYPQQPAPPAGAYPQQAYPQQAYPQQAYPQQAYPQQAYQAYPPPPYAPAPYPAPPPRRKPRLSKGLLVAGIVTLSTSYGMSLIVGTSLIDSHCCDEVGAYMLVPVIGPYMAASKAEDAKGVLTLLGTVEVVVMGLLIGGIIRYQRSKREAEAAGFYSWSLPEGRTLSLDVAASPRLLGPRMQLSF